MLSPGYTHFEPDMLHPLVPNILQHSALVSFVNVQTQYASKLGIELNTAESLQDWERNHSYNEAWMPIYLCWSSAKLRQYQKSYLGVDRCRWHISLPQMAHLPAST